MPKGREFVIRAGHVDVGTKTISMRLLECPIKIVNETTNSIKASLNFGVFNFVKADN